MGPRGIAYPGKNCDSSSELLRVEQVRQVRDRQRGCHPGSKTSWGYRVGNEGADLDEGCEWMEKKEEYKEVLDRRQNRLDAYEGNV